MASQVGVIKRETNGSQCWHRSAQDWVKDIWPRMMKWLPENSTLNLILVGALFAVLFIDFVLADIPELFPGAARIGSIVHALSLAYIASYIFYIVVVQIKSVRDREQVLPYVALKTRQLVSGLREITHQIALGADADDPSVKYPSREQFAEMTRNIRMADPGPEPYRRLPTPIATWWDFFKHWKELTEDRLNALLANSQFLAAEHIRLLQNIRENTFFSVLDIFSDSVPSENCSFLSVPLYQLSESTKALDNYCEKHFGNVARFQNEG